MSYSSSVSRDLSPEECISTGWDYLFVPDIVTAVEIEVALMKQQEAQRSILKDKHDAPVVERAELFEGLYRTGYRLELIGDAITTIISNGIDELELYAYKKHNENINGEHNEN